MPGPDGSPGTWGLPRVTLLARDGRGWAALCRLVSATHLRGERGSPVCTVDLVGRHASGGSVGAATDQGALTVLLGPGSELGRALLARRTDLARAVLARWYDALPLGALAVEVVCHDGPEGSAASLRHAARMLGFAREAGPFDAIVAVGGGSAIDTAKAVNLLTTNPGELMDYLNPPVGGGRAPSEPLRCAALSLLLKIARSWRMVALCCGGRGKGPGLLSGACDKSPAA